MGTTLLWGRTGVQVVCDRCGEKRSADSVCADSKNSSCRQARGLKAVLLAGVIFLAIVYPLTVGIPRSGLQDFRQAAVSPAANRAKAQTREGQTRREKRESRRMQNREELDARTRALIALSLALLR